MEKFSMIGSKEEVLEVISEAVKVEEFEQELSLNNPDWNEQENQDERI